MFGLNAIGGALSIQMKNGFTYHGVEIEAFGGSYGRVQGSVQAGGQKDNVSAYALFESAYDRGWRDFANSSHVNRMYVDVGARNDDTELHVNFTGADNILGNVAATPVELLNQRWSSVYTWPQTTHLQLAFLNTTLSHTFSDTWSFQGNAYYRGFRQSHVDGNGTDVGRAMATQSVHRRGKRQRSRFSVPSAVRRLRIHSAPPSSVNSTATRSPATVSAAPRSSPTPTSCSATTTTSSWAPASTMASPSSPRTANSERSTRTCS